MAAQTAWRRPKAGRANVRSTQEMRRSRDEIKRRQLLALSVAVETLQDFQPDPQNQVRPDEYRTVLTQVKKWQRQLQVLISSSP